MDEVLELATKLSNAIARSTRFTDLRAAEATVMADKEAVDKMSQRDTALSRLRLKEQKGEAIEPEEKRELAELDEFIRTNGPLAELFRAQADFQEMLNRVNRLITSALDPDEATEKASDTE